MENKKIKLFKSLIFGVIIFTLFFAPFLLLAADQTQPKTAAEPNILLEVPLLTYSKATNIAEYIKNIYKASLYIIIPFIIIIIIGSGILWILAGGDKKLISTAKERIKFALIGLCIALFSYVLLSFVGITELKPPSAEYIEPEELPDVDLSSAIATGSPDAITSTNASYQAICTKYGGSYKEAVALECKALGNNPPAGLNIVSMGKYGKDSGQKAEAGAFERFKKSADCVKSKFGKTITASGWRSAAGQYAAYQKNFGTGYAAKPCCSNHGKGVAFDVRINGVKVSNFGTSDQYLKECFNANGLYANLRGGVSEPWHYSPSGK
ncbi:MAG: M15 family metallopeptidase [Candidatus Parcubacteria bacterium]|nr:M15 family metallopeptidase [Candidatus Parcubacteria bacterium]